MIKISAVSYLNTSPFIFGIEKYNFDCDINLSLHYPSKCADLLLNNKVDLALVPVVIIPELVNSYIISDFCIGANGKVDTVCLFSNIPMEKIQHIFLDYQSRTSVVLLKLLLKEYWNINPKFSQLTVDNESSISKNDAVLVIGDRAFNQFSKYKFSFDLSCAWKKMTKLPFVFAVWVANKKLPLDFITSFNNALSYGLSNINTNSFLQDIKYTKCINPREYLLHRICYNFDSKKKKAMDIFLNKL